MRCIGPLGDMWCDPKNHPKKSQHRAAEALIKYENTWLLSVATDSLYQEYRSFRDCFNNPNLSTTACRVVLHHDRRCQTHVSTQPANLTGVLMMVLIYAKTHKQPCPLEVNIKPLGKISKIRRGQNEF